MILYIGNKNYSSWSMRSYLTMKHSGLKFEEILVPLYTDDTKTMLNDKSPTKKVPALHRNGNIVWDSLAICEYINELAPNANLWPQDSKLRAVARSICCEMHSSFFSLRNECPMNMKRGKHKKLSQSALEDIKRISEIWSYCRKISGSTQYLFQDFTIADAFFAPIISRIVSYQINIEEHNDYIKTICDNEFYQEWYNEALNEKWILSDVDNS